MGDGALEMMTYVSARAFLCDSRILVLNTTRITGAWHFGNLGVLSTVVATERLKIVLLKSK